MQTVVVTGANGFIGSAVVKELLSHDVYVIAVSRKSSNLPKDKNLQFIPLDMKDMHQLKELINGKTPDIFYHFAWDGSAGEARADMSMQLLNVQYTVEAVKIASELGCKRFVGAGSIMEKEAYSSTMAQGNKPGRGDIYGTAKLAAHCMSKSVAASCGVEHVWAVITNAYGCGEVSPRFVNTTIRKIINNEPLSFTAGTQNYDFVYIDDVALAFYRIGEGGKPFNEYTIGSSKAQPLRNFVVEMCSRLCPEREPNFGDMPFTGVALPLSDFNCENTSKDTGFKATTSFAEGTYRTMEWLKGL
ncbi:MAG: NAD(P)-dependent oxidoreductase [Deferribacteraceae bacterium]|jgi:nucleoside-diphosphate-sugar epimerase|nr:NAD(P)-dependent oxidoreductase [Deferribacteraceae bacterium]